MSLAAGGTFSADLQASDVSHSISVRFHYSANGTSGSWSATKAFTPDALSGTPASAGTVGVFSLAGLVGLILIGTSLRRRRMLVRQPTTRSAPMP